MDMTRYHNRSTDGIMTFTEVMVGSERFKANLEMGFVELPNTEEGRDQARFLKIEPMEGMPQIPVAMADPRLMKQHADEIASYESRLEALGKERDDWCARAARADADLKQALADKARLLTNYEKAVEKAAGEIDAPKPKPGKA